MAKIIKNESGSDIDLVVGGFTVGAGEQIEVNEQNYSLLAIQDFIDEIEPYLNSGDIVINNGSEDLPADVAKQHLISIQGVVLEHNDVTLIPSAGENAPELVKISDSITASCMRIGDEIFGHTRMDNLAGGDVPIQLHMVIDNAVSDRWIQFEVSYFTTTGLDEKPANSIDGTVTMGPVEVPTTPYGVFEANVDIPASAWQNGENYLFIGVKRVAATGKTAPTNHPGVLRYCKRYFKKLES